MHILVVMRPADLHILLNETANECPEDMKQHSTDKENNIENDERNLLGEKVVDSEKCCSFTNKTDLRRRDFQEHFREMRCKWHFSYMYFRK